MTGIIVGGRLIANNTVGICKSTGVPTGTWGTARLGTTGDAWGFYYFDGGMAGNLRLSTNFYVPSGASGAVYVDNVVADLYYVTHQDKTEKRDNPAGYFNNPLYRRQI